MSIYKRGRTFWFSFVFKGRRVQRSTGVSNKNDARDIERGFWAQLSRQEVGLDAAAKDLTIGQILDASEMDLKFLRGGALNARDRSNFKRARAAFQDTMQARLLTDADVDGFIRKRQRENVAPATINRTLELIRAAFRKAVDRKDIKEAPKFRHLSEEGNTRVGFFTDLEFRALLSHLPEDLRDFTLFGYLTGWRKSEIASVIWADVQEGVIRLRGINTKNGEGRSVMIAGELVAVIERRRQARLIKFKHAPPTSDVLTQFVFHRDGLPVREFKKSWAKACAAAGLGKFVCPKCEKEGDAKECSKCKKTRAYVGRIFHDLRRTAIRNMVRSGVPQSVAMKISGHRTSSMFRRYDIANEDDLRAAMESVERYHDREKTKVIVMEQK